MAEHKKKKTCICPTTMHCNRMVRSEKNRKALDSIKGESIEGYDLVYITGIGKKHLSLFGAPKGTVSCLKIDLTQEVHRKAHQRAGQGKTVSYEWSAYCEKNNCFFQSTLIPLRNSQGKIDSILGLVKSITDWVDTNNCQQFLRKLNHRTFPQVLLMTREEERRKLSSALHDEIGSSAVILTSLLSMVKESVKNQDQGQALKDIRALDKEIKSSIERIKNIVVSMRPPNLDTVGLEATLRDMVENAARYGRLKYHFEFNKEDKLQVCDEVRIVLYRVVQEGLNNILKHAKATKVDVVIKRGTQNITLSIKDNGCGFAQTRQRSIEHIGLLSMRDSVAYLGGKFIIKSELGKGTEIQVICPKSFTGR